MAPTASPAARGSCPTGEISPAGGRRSVAGPGTTVLPRGAVIAVPRAVVLRAHSGGNRTGHRARPCGCVAPGRHRAGTFRLLAAPVEPTRKLRTPQVSHGRPPPTLKGHTTAMRKLSLDAHVREHLGRADASPNGRSAGRLYGGHEHVLRQTPLAVRAGTVLAEHENPTCGRGRPRTCSPRPQPGGPRRRRRAADRRQDRLTHSAHVRVRRHVGGALVCGVPAGRAPFARFLSLRRGPATGRGRRPRTGCCAPGHRPGAAVCGCRA